MVEEGYLDTGDGHAVFWSAHGIPEGTPCLVLHGGPGAGSSESVRDLFDPDRVRVIQIDQRGAGRSLPTGELMNNTTHDLIADIEQLRAHLGIARWHVFAGSWGTTVALLYAAVHRGACESLILRGVTEWSADKYAWALDGRRFLAPQAHAYLLEILSLAEQGDIVGSYYARILAGEREAAKRWHLYEKWFSDPDPWARIDDEARLAPDFERRARIHVHYWQHDAFLAPGEMEAAIDAVAGLPVHIVHGGLDFVCAPLFAWRLASKLPNAKLVMVPDGRHAAGHPPIAAALRQVLAQLGLARP